MWPDNGDWGRGSGPRLPDMFILESVKIVTLGGESDHSIESPHRETGQGRGGGDPRSHASASRGILIPVPDWQESAFDDIIAPQNPKQRG